MLFDHNDINLGNYEEYFVLYMDNELTEDQRKMVEDFLLVNPDLQAELEILMGTKLPAEEFSFDKKALLAESMKLNTVDEDLLLFIDGELSAEKNTLVELELTSNATYQAQYRHLLQTKLDATEVIACPDKKELYRRTERAVLFQPWMRIAAAVLVMAAMGIFYFSGNDSLTVAPPVKVAVKNQLPSGAQPSQKAIKAGGPSIELAIAESKPTKQDMAAPDKERQTDKRNEVNNPLRQVNDLMARNTAEDAAYTSPAAKATTTIAANPGIEATTASFDPTKEIINKSGVTSALSQRNTSINATEYTVPNDVASNTERKGSFKSFLRKATRLIERKTGIDPTSGDDEELLIGAVAVKLK
jgi:hypothetical protein